MPTAAEFLSEEQKNQYGRFSGEPNDVQLAHYFHLDDTDLSLINKRRRDYSRLGFALQLTTVRFLGTFLVNPTQVPRGVLHFIAQQLGITQLNCLEQYLSRKITRYEHSAEIQGFYGYHDFSTPPWRFRLSRLLYSKAWVSNERPSLMFDYAADWLIRHKILLPGVSILSRLISEIRERANNRLWCYLSLLPTSEQKQKLLGLLEISEGNRSSKFDQLRQGPTTVSGPAFNEAVSRYLELQSFDIGNLNFSKIPPVRLKNVARHAGILSVYKVARMKGNKKIALLTAFVRHFEISALDDALDILDLLITDIINSAKRIGQKKRLRTLKDLDKSALSLAAACSMLLDEDTKDENLRDAIFSQYPKDKFAIFVETVNELARPKDDHFHEELIEQYGRVKRFLSPLLNHIKFQAIPAGEDVLSTFEYLQQLGLSRKQVLVDAPTEIINKSWSRLVMDDQNRINRRGYVLCLLEKLQDKLRRRDIYAQNSERWGDPRDKLLHEDIWEANRVQVCRSLNHPKNAAEIIDKLSQQLDSAYQEVSVNLENNSEVRIDDSGKIPSLTITNLDKLEDSPSLADLKNQVADLLPTVDLTELLLEIHALTGFANE